MKRRYAVVGFATGLSLYMVMPPWVASIVIVGGGALVLLVVLLVFEHLELRDERRHSADLTAWIDAHDLGTGFVPHDGDEVQR